MKIQFLALSVVQGVLAHGPANSKDFMVVKRENKPFKHVAQFGESHGTSFNDVMYTFNNKNRIVTINLSGCNPGSHLGFLETLYGQVPTSNALPSAATESEKPYKPAKSSHGKIGGGDQSLSLAQDEYITQVDLTTWRAKVGFRTRHTRIGSISFTTNQGQIRSCGSKWPTDDHKSWSFPGYALYYFGGSAGEAIDALYATFIPVENYFV